MTTANFTFAREMARKVLKDLKRRGKL